ncbi:hypothetical protein Efla_003489 [Eimeria flavescens]
MGQPPGESTQIQQDKTITPARPPATAAARPAAAAARPAAAAAAPQLRTSCSLLAAAAAAAAATAAGAVQQRCGAAAATTRAAAECAARAATTAAAECAARVLAAAAAAAALVPFYSQLLLSSTRKSSSSSSKSSSGSSKMSTGSSASSRRSVTRRVSHPHPQRREEQQQQQQQQQQQDEQQQVSVSSFQLVELSSVAAMLCRARRVLIVPGYGVALSRCAAELAECSKLLLTSRVVEFAISPIAGRLPSHLSLFLEAVPEHFKKTGTQANACMLTYDLCLVVGAGAIVNPAFQKQVHPAAGMVVEVWKAPRVVVLRRSRAPPPLAEEQMLEEGGPPPSLSCYDSEELFNPLFKLPNVGVLAGDAKKTLSELTHELRRMGAGQQGSSELRGGGGWPPLQIDDDLAEEETDALRPARWPQPQAAVGVLRDNLGAGIVSLDPAHVPRLRALGFRVLIERQTSPAAGAAAGAAAATAAGEEEMQESVSDEAYRLRGAEITSLEGLLQEADILLHASIPPLEYFLSPSSAATTPTTTATAAATAAAGGEKKKTGEGGRILVCNYPRDRPSPVFDSLAAANWLVLSLAASSPLLQARGVEVTQSLEALRGYRAFIEATHALPRVVKGLTTAAGRIDPAVVLVLGAGAAGLHAAATAHKAGSSVFVADVHAAAKPLVESIGASFLSVLCALRRWGALQHFPKIQEGLRQLCERSDVIICCPQDFEGGPPQLIPSEWLPAFKRGAVLVDLAAHHPQAAPGWCGCVQQEGVAREGSPPGGPAEAGEGGEGGGAEAGAPTIISGCNVEACMPLQVTRLLSASVCALLEALLKGGSPPGGRGPLHVQLLRQLEDPILQQLVVAKEGELTECPHWGFLKGRRTLSRRLSGFNSALDTPKSKTDGGPSEGGPPSALGSRFFEGPQ